MGPCRLRSSRTLPVAALALVLAALLTSCSRGADTPASERASADAAAPAPAPPPPPPPRELTWSGKVDMTLWSAIRVKTYKAALKQPTPPTLAILRIPRLELEVPVYDGTTDAVLDLAAGRIGSHGPAGDGRQRRHCGPPGRILSDLEGHQGGRCPGAGHARRARTLPRGVDPDHHARRRQRDQSDAWPCRHARRVLSVLPQRSGPETVHRARSACGTGRSQLRPASYSQ